MGKEMEPVSEKAVSYMEKDLEDLLNFYLCPEPMRIKLRTTNVIERAFREVKRRILTMSCFNNNKTLRRSYMRYSGHLND